MTKLNFRIALVAMLCSQLFLAQELSFNYLLIPEELKSNCNAIVQYNDIEVVIKSQTTLDYTVRRAVTVKNERGDSSSLIRISFDKNRKIEDVRAYVYDQFGKEIKKIKKKDFNDISASDGFSLYTDNRMLYYDYTPVSYPYTIVYEYQMSSNSTGFIPGWYPIPGYLESVRSSSYKITSEAGIPLRYKANNFENFDIQEVTNTNTELHFTVSNVPGIKYEPLGFQFEDYFPTLRLGVNQFSLEGIKGSASDWKAFGKWRYEFLKNGNDELDESVKAMIRAEVAHLEDPIDKAKYVYKFMQDRTHYISVQEGVGGWMPIPANEVHSVGYGDCKGLTNYTKALLDAVGVKSNYTVLWAGEEIKSVEKDFHSMQGNHVILNLPTNEGDIWLECTSQKVPFGFIAGFTDDRDVLVISPEGGEIKHTKVYSPEENAQHTTGNYSIDFKGGIEADLKIVTTGFQYSDHMYSYEGKSPVDQEKRIKNYFDDISDLQIEKFDFNNNLEDSKFEETFELKAANYGSFSGNQMFLVVNAFNRSSYVPKRVRNRKIPMDLDRGYVDKDEVTINLPKNMQVEFVPEKVELTTEFGSYSLEFEKIDGHTYLYRRVLKMNGGKYEPEAYEAYRKFRKNISKYDNSKIILTKPQL